jgi:hypothetical protein
MELTSSASVNGFASHNRRVTGWLVVVEVVVVVVVVVPVVEDVMMHKDDRVVSLLEYTIQ